MSQYGSPHPPLRGTLSLRERDALPNFHDVVEADIAELKFLIQVLRRPLHRIGHVIRTGKRKINDVKPGRSQRNCTGVLSRVRRNKWDLAQLQSFRGHHTKAEVRPLEWSPALGSFEFPQWK